MKRKLLALFLTLCLVLPLFPAVTLAEDEVVATYELVTEAPEDWSGRYLIVYEDPTIGCLAMDSSLSTLDAKENYRSLPNEGNTIISNADNDVYFTISKNGTGYSIASKNGKYMNQSSNANGLQTVSQPDDPLSIALNEDGSVDIVGAEGAHLRFNSLPDQMRFRFYKTDSYNNQQPIYLYKLKDGNTTPEAGEDHVFKLVTNEEDLAAGGTYLIANSNEAGSGKVASKQTNNNRSAFDVVVTDDLTIVLNDSAIANEKGVDLAYTFTLGGETNVWTFYDAATGGYLYAASSSSNYLRTETELDDNGTFIIEISAEGVATVTARGENERNLLRYNKQSDLFACYASGQQPVYLYKLVEPETPTEKPKFGNCSVVLSGQIGMNFYMNLPDAYTDGTMEFTVGDRTATAAGVKQDDGRYKFTCYLTSVEMAEQITAVYTYEIDGVSESVNKIISVQGYLGTMIANADNDPEFAKASALAKALWNYGYYAQLAVADGKNHPPMANDYIGDANLPSSISGFDVAASLDNAMIVSATYSLTLDTETALNIYLTPAEGITLTKENVSVAATGADVEYAVEPVGSRYRVRITGIGAHELGTKITITAGTSTVTASALSYVQKCLANENAKPEAKNAAAALYRYYQETIHYMEEIGQ